MSNTDKDTEKDMASAIDGKTTAAPKSRAKKQYPVEAIIADYQAGVPTGELNRRHGTTQSTLYRILRENNVPKRNWKSLGEVDVEQYTQDCATMTRAARAAKYGVTVKETRKKDEELGLVHVKKPARKTDDEMIKEVVRLYTDEQMSPARIAEIMPLAKTTIYEIVTKAGALPDFKSRVKKTNQIRRGVDWVSQDPAVREKYEATMLKNWGVTNTGSSPEIRQRMEAGFVAAGLDVDARRKGGEEIALRGFLNELTGELFNSTWDILGTQEIDCYSPALKLAVEYCGLYWHCEESPTGRGRSYHNRKREVCEEQGIRLITIFGDEWNLRKEQVKGYLRSVLKANPVKVHGRKTDVRSVTSAVGRDFLERYHIQGASQGGKHFAGLFLGDDLLGVMSFGAHHRASTQTVLDRLCFKAGVTVSGGSSKLFKFLTEATGVDSLISWSDNRWNQGAVYQALGFDLDGELPPDYSYVDSNEVSSKRRSKQSQRKVSSGCPEGTTESQWATQRGLWKIWDCGKRRWKWNKETE